MKKFLLSLSLFIFIIGLTGCDIEIKEITIPHDSYYYDHQYDGTVDELVQHFKDLGFERIETSPIDYSGYQQNAIWNVTIDNGWFGFHEGDIFYSSDKVEIEYLGNCNNLTIENCEDLKNILTNSEASYMDFLEKYDGKYIEFDGWVDTNISFWDNTSHVITVYGGDYNEGLTQGLNIHIEVDVPETSDMLINENVTENSNVKIIGKVSKYRGEYYKQVVVVAEYFTYRKEK